MTASNSPGKAILGVPGLIGLLALALIGTCVSTALTWQRDYGLISTVSLKDIKPVGDYMYESRLPAEFLPRKRVYLPAGTAVMAEDGRPYVRPITFESDIRQHGHGGYRFEGERVVFSSLDGSAPDKNGRIYTVSAPAIRTTERWILLCWAVSVAAWVLFVLNLFRILILLRASARFTAACLAAWQGIQTTRAAYEVFYEEQKAKAPALERFCRLLLPLPFAVGVLAGAGFCILLGHIAAGVDIYGDRPRFFEKIAPEGYVYPTVENFSRFVEGKAPRDRILVLVGGSSILLGVGQTNDEVWTKKLQKDLGDQFAVVNVSLRGAAFTSIGMPLAEMLSKEYPRLYLVTDTVPFQQVKWVRYQKGTYSYPYDYFLWQSWVDGKLMPGAARDLKLSATAGSLLPDTQQFERLHDLVGNEAGEVRTHAQEEVLHALFEKFTDSSNLWNAIGYRYFFTVYSFLLRPDEPFLLPRKMIRDDELKDSERLPVPERFEKDLSAELSILPKQYFLNVDNTAGGVPHFKPDAYGSIEALKQELPAGFPRDHLLFLVTSKSAYTVSHLSPDDQRTYRQVISAGIGMLRDAGYRAIPFGLDYSADDYVDGSHFSVKAAPKMARDVAAELQDMAKKDGWLNEGK